MQVLSSVRLRRRHCSRPQGVVCSPQPSSSVVQQLHQRISCSCTGAFAPGLVTPASFAARSRLAAGGHLCGRDGYVAVGGLFSPTDAAISLLDTSKCASASE